MTKQEAAKQRVEWALERIGATVESFDKTMQALSSVMGVPEPIFKRLRKLSSDTKGVFYDLRNQLEVSEQLALDRKPDESEQRYAPPPPEEAPPVNKHPAQPVIVDDDGVHRFKKNKIVRHLLDNGPLDMNKLAMMDFSDEDREQFAQLIGYSVSGASELEYVSDAVIDEAMRQSKMLTRMKKES